MLREDAVYFGLGGAGNRLVDTLMMRDSRFKGYFINTSITDIESLNNSSSLIKNYFCISQQNGVGRNREVGKAYAEDNVMSIVDKMFKYQQETIYLVFSLCGGSGSSIASVVLNKITELRMDGAFDKTVNAICILPDLNSPDVILRNAINTWNEIIQSKAINSMIVIDNNVNIEARDEDEKEIAINERFVEMFDSVFDIPDVNGLKFDSGNLGNVLNDKGCLYIYDLPSNCGSIEVAMNKAETNSVLAKMFKTSKNIITHEDGTTSIGCGYIGISLNDEMYDPNYILNNYTNRKEEYKGVNEDKNLVLISGCLPPFYSIQVIEQELLDREKNLSSDEEDDIFGSFVANKIPSTNLHHSQNSKPQNSVSSNKLTNTTTKRVMKKSLFKR